MELQKKRADCENVDTATVWETGDVQPWELSEGALIDIKEESSCDKRMKMPQKKWHQQKISHHRNAEVFHALKVQRTKCWKLIQTKKGICHSPRHTKDTHSVMKLYDKKASTVQSTQYVNYMIIKPST